MTKSIRGEMHAVVVIDDHRYVLGADSAEEFAEPVDSSFTFTVPIADGSGFHAWFSAVSYAGWSRCFWAVLADVAWRQAIEHPSTTVRITAENGEELWRKA